MPNNNASNQTNRNVRVISGYPPAHTPADMEAAAALVALSQGNPNHNPSSTRGTLIWDVRTDSRRLEPVFENENGRVNPFARAQNNGASSIPAPCDFNAMLAERLWSISLVHLVPPEIEFASERFTAGAMPPTVLQVSRRSEIPMIPEELGRFVDLWTDYGYTRHTIGEMLARNNVMIPRSYISERLASRQADSDNDLRSFSDGGLDVEMDDSGYEVDDEEEGDDGEDDDDEDGRGDRQSELEFWYDEH
ncbi:hypothetical protein EPUS_06013 [Endocarpon pusillum Z07020]|uniref:Uncharacterized protein n=1 Tax=Endocarpon pusillum (strain Z07020 / HMAS-L-300199) TaxID=1263415 RepID=U1HQ52_ENDPU|nr:uncharacterized protein EPUS_06013 [Endocarpon pusillum Z07020]ERF71184.1 hypothetical protein EPUS_06013 [Endocarpon pusillum Z07020]